MKPFASVHAVMLNWNSYDVTSECLRSLKKSLYRLQRIIVVDQASSDGSCDRLEHEFQDDQVVFVRNERNEGFAGGMNIGFRLALATGAEMVFSINNDTEVDPECIGLLVRALESDQSSGIAGPAIMYHKYPDRIWLVGGHFSKLRAGILVPEKGKRIHDIPTTTRRVTFLTGCAILIRKKVLEEVGSLDTSYFFYSEDLDYDLRVLEQGMHLLFVPEAHVWHKIEEVAADRTSPYVLYHLARSTVLVFRKRFSAPYRWYAVLLQVVLYTPFRLWQVIQGGARPRSFWAWVGGLWAGIRADRTTKAPAF